MDWLQLWVEDKRMILDCMVRNMVADLNAGYDYFGNSIRRQITEIEAYKAESEAQMRLLERMPKRTANDWCFRDLLERGAISA